MAPRPITGGVGGVSPKALAARRVKVPAVFAPFNSRPTPAPRQNFTKTATWRNPVRSGQTRVSVRLNPNVGPNPFPSSYPKPKPVLIPKMGPPPRPVALPRLSNLTKQSLSSLYRGNDLKDKSFKGYMRLMDMMVNDPEGRRYAVESADRMLRSRDHIKKHAFLTGLASHGRSPYTDLVLRHYWAKRGIGKELAQSMANNQTSSNPLAAAMAPYRGDVKPLSYSFDRAASFVTSNAKRYARDVEINQNPGHWLGSRVAQHVGNAIASTYDVAREGISHLPGPAGERARADKQGKRVLVAGLPALPTGEKRPVLNNLKALGLIGLEQYQRLPNAVLGPLTEEVKAIKAGRFKDLPAAALIGTYRGAIQNKYYGGGQLLHEQFGVPKTLAGVFGVPIDIAADPATLFSGGTASVARSAGKMGVRRVARDAGVRLAQVEGKAAAEKSIKAMVSQMEMGMRDAKNLRLENMAKERAALAATPAGRKRLAKQGLSFEITPAEIKAVEDQFAKRAASKAQKIRFNEYQRRGVVLASSPAKMAQQSPLALRARNRAVENAYLRTMNGPFVSASRATFARVPISRRINKDIFGLNLNRGETLARMYMSDSRATGAALPSILSDGSRGRDWRQAVINNSPYAPDKADELLKSFETFSVALKNDVAEKSDLIREIQRLDGVAKDKSLPMSERSSANDALDVARQKVARVNYRIGDVQDQIKRMTKKHHGLFSRVGIGDNVDLRAIASKHNADVRPENIDPLTWEEMRATKAKWRAMVDRGNMLADSKANQFVKRGGFRRNNKSRMTVDQYELFKHVLQNPADVRSRATRFIPKEHRALANEVFHTIGLDGWVEHVKGMRQLRARKFGHQANMDISKIGQLEEVARTKFSQPKISEFFKIVRLHDQSEFEAAVKKFLDDRAVILRHDFMTSTRDLPKNEQAVALGKFEKMLEETSAKQADLFTQVRAVGVDQATVIGRGLKQSAALRAHGSLVDRLTGDGPELAKIMSQKIDMSPEEIRKLRLATSPTVKEIKTVLHVVITRDVFGAHAVGKQEGVLLEALPGGRYRFMPKNAPAGSEALVIHKSDILATTSRAGRGAQKSAVPGETVRVDLGKAKQGYSDWVHTLLEDPRFAAVLKLHTDEAIHVLDTALSRRALLENPAWDGKDGFLQSTQRLLEETRKKSIKVGQNISHRANYDTHLDVEMLNEAVRADLQRRIVRRKIRKFNMFSKISDHVVDERVGSPALGLTDHVDPTRFGARIDNGLAANNMDPFWYAQARTRRGTGTELNREINIAAPVGQPERYLGVSVNMPMALQRYLRAVNKNIAAARHASETLGRFGKSVQTSVTWQAPKASAAASERADKLARQHSKNLIIASSSNNEAISALKKLFSGPVDKPVINALTEANNDYLIKQSKLNQLVAGERYGINLPAESQTLRESLQAEVDAAEAKFWTVLSSVLSDARLSAPATAELITDWQRLSGIALKNQRVMDEYATYGLPSDRNITEAEKVDLAQFLHAQDLSNADGLERLKTQLQHLARSRSAVAQVARSNPGGTGNSLAALEAGRPGAHKELRYANDIYDMVKKFADEHPVGEIGSLSGDLRFDFDRWFVEKHGNAAFEKFVPDAGGVKEHPWGVSGPKPNVPHPLEAIRLIADAEFKSKISPPTGLLSPIGKQMSAAHSLNELAYQYFKDSDRLSALLLGAHNDFAKAFGLSHDFAAEFRGEMRDIEDLVRKSSGFVQREDPMNPTKFFPDGPRIAIGKHLPEFNPSAYLLKKGQETLGVPHTADEMLQHAIEKINNLQARLRGDTTSYVRGERSIPKLSDNARAMVDQFMLDHGRAPNRDEINSIIASASGDSRRYVFKDTNGRIRDLTVDEVHRVYMDGPKITYEMGTVGTAKEIATGTQAFKAADREYKKAFAEERAVLSEVRSRALTIPHVQRMIAINIQRKNIEGALKLGRPLSSGELLSIRTEVEKNFSVESLDWTQVPLPFQELQKRVYEVTANTAKAFAKREDIKNHLASLKQLTPRTVLTPSFLARPVEMVPTNLTDEAGKPTFKNIGGLGGGQVYAVEQPVYEYLLGDPENLAGWLGKENVLNRFQAAWKYGVTVVVPAFHMRNFFGDTQNSALAQGTISFLRNLPNAVRVARFIRLKELHEARVMGSTRDTPSMSKIGESKWIDFNDKSLAGSSRTMNRLLFGRDETWHGMSVAEIARWALEDNVANAGIIRDIYETQHRSMASFGRNNLYRGSTISRLAQKPSLFGKRYVPKYGSPIEGRTGVLGAMESFNRFRENIPRINTYIAGLQQSSGNRMLASRLATKHHFDYQELSQTEKMLRDNFMPFYTWTSRNTGLWASALVQRPGYIANFASVRNEIAYASGIEPDWQSNLSLSDQLAMPVPVRTGPNSWRTLSMGAGGWPVSALNFGPLGLLTGLLGIGGAGLNDYMQAVQDNIVSLIAPWIKIPVELSTNYSFFLHSAIKPDWKQLVPAPRGVDKLVKVMPWMAQWLDIHPDYVDKNTGKKMWGWSADAQYMLEQLPPGWGGLLTRFATKRTTLVGGEQQWWETALGLTLGVRAKNYDPVTQTLRQMKQVKRDLELAQYKIRQLSNYRSRREYQVTQAKIRQLEGGITRAEALSGVKRTNTGGGNSSSVSAPKSGGSGGYGGGYGSGGYGGGYGGGGY